MKMNEESIRPAERDYEILGVLGSGGDMPKVYKVRNVLSEPH